MKSAAPVPADAPDPATFVAVGALGPDELFEAHRSLVECAPALVAVVDLSSATLDRIDADGLRQLVRRAAQLAKERHACGRVAIVCVREIDFGIARMFSMLASVEGHPVRFAVFPGPHAARAWLAGEPVSP